MRGSPVGNLVLLVVLVAGVASAVAYGHFKTIRLGNLSEDDLDAMARDFVWAARTAPGPWAWMIIKDWHKDAGLTLAQVIQVQRYAQRRGWIWLPRRNFLDVAAGIPSPAVQLTQQGYDMNHRHEPGPSINFAGPVVGNPTIAQSGRDQSVVMQIRDPQANSAPQQINWPALVEAIRHDQPGLSSYDRAATEQIINDITDAGTTGPEPDRSREILSWLRDKIAGSVASSAGSALWSATASFFESLNDR